MGLYLHRFNIRDLEEFSGVKAHTIRMWEKRYGLLRPDRTDTNIRTYGLEELKSILNVAFLNRHGHKISKIAAMSPGDRDLLVREMAAASGQDDGTVEMLKVAMLGFDEVMFDSVASKFRETNGFRALVERVFVPLLERIGLLWQANAICPAQEHFVSNIIRHKLIVATDALPMQAAGAGPAYVLYLPENEIHELGLLYLNYLLRAKGCRTIYLGQSVPRSDLGQVAAMFTGPLVLVSVLMADPPVSEVPAYLTALRADLPDPRIKFWIAGAQLARTEPMNVPDGMTLHPSLNALVATVDQA